MIGGDGGGSRLGAGSVRDFCSRSEVALAGLRTQGWEHTRRLTQFVHRAAEIASGEGVPAVEAREEARRRLDAMDPEVRALYEGGIKPNPEIVSAGLSALLKDSK